MLLRIVKEANTTYLTLLRDMKDVITKVLMDEWKDVSQFFEDIKNKVQKYKWFLENMMGSFEPLLQKTEKSFF